MTNSQSLSALSSTDRNIIDVTYSLNCSHLTCLPLFDFDWSRHRLRLGDIGASFASRVSSWMGPGGHVWLLCTSTVAGRPIRMLKSPRKREILNALAPVEHSCPSLEGLLRLVLQESLQRAGCLLRVIVPCAELEWHGASLDPKWMFLWRLIMGSDLLSLLRQTNLRW